MNSKRSKDGLSFEEHQRLGEQLRSIRDALLPTVTLLSNRYRKTSKQVLQADRALDGIDRLICLMDTTLFDEYSQYATEELVRVYYGRPAPGGQNTGTGCPQ